MGARGGRGRGLGRPGAGIGRGPGTWAAGLQGNVTLPALGEQSCEPRGAGTPCVRSPTSARPRGRSAGTAVERVRGPGTLGTVFAWWGPGIWDPMWVGGRECGVGRDRVRGPRGKGAPALCPASGTDQGRTDPRRGPNEVLGGCPKSLPVCPPHGREGHPRGAGEGFRRRVVSTAPGASTG